jgi:GT2 family glycosyltransferase
MATTRRNRPRKVVVLGMMSRIPVAGVIWQNLHYLLGFERLGFEAYYVETHGRTPTMLMKHPDDDSSARAAKFISRIMRGFDLGGRWAFHALHDDGRCYGMTLRQLERLYRSADLLIDLHGGTHPLPELAASGRLIYLETDPVELQLELHRGDQATIDFLEPHGAFFTFGENWGNEDCLLPVSERFQFQPTRQPVVLDLWSGRAAEDNGLFTTVGNWKQRWRTLKFKGETYTWSKHDQFRRFIDLPKRFGPRFELALSSISKSDRGLLERRGWLVRDGLALSREPGPYRSYIGASRGEFTVAKDQNVRLRTGWFSDRSATYLAAGRPVITQDTGFGSVLPTGAGLFAFSDVGDVAAALEAIDADYGAQAAAARDVAREYFGHDVVLGRLLDDLGMKAPRRRRGGRGRELYPPGMRIAPLSRRPIRLPEPTIEAVLERPVPFSLARASLDSGSASIVVVTYENRVLTRLCLETLLAHSGDTRFEVIVVDNGSRDGTAAYLTSLAERNPRVRAVLNGTNLGFAPACNEGLALARAEHVVLLNNDVILPPRWLPALLAHLTDPSVGLVGPTTNRIGNEAEVEASYRTWGGFLQFARERQRDLAGTGFEVPVLAMYCMAMRRSVYEELGPLDERFQVGLLEDDDYAERARQAGYGLRCAQDVFVHHFGEASFGELVPTGEYARLLAENKRRYREKWGKPWQPYGRRHGDGYRALTERVRRLVAEAVPPRSAVLVLSRGDDELVKLSDRKGMHFPQAANGDYAGHHPADSDEVIRQLEEMRARGAEFLVIPQTGHWYLDHYAGFRRHLKSRYRPIVRRSGTAVIYGLTEEER